MVKDKEKGKGLRNNDLRYKLAGRLVKEGDIKVFDELFAIVPKTTFAMAMGMNLTRFDKLRKKLSLFRLEELFLIAYLLEIDERTVIDLVLNSMSRKDKKQSPPALPIM